MSQSLSHSLVTSVDTDESSVRLVLGSYFAILFPLQAVPDTYVPMELLHRQPPKCTQTDVVP